MQVRAKFDKDTRRYHRYVIDDRSIKGTIYFLKDSTIPDTVLIQIGETNEGEQNSG